MPETVYGQNSIFTKENKRLTDNDFSVYNSNLIDGVNQVIDLNANIDKQQAAHTLGHEAFVHADKDADALNAMDKKTADGYYSMNPNRYSSDARRIAIGALEDHQALGRGEVKKYE